MKNVPPGDCLSLFDEFDLNRHRERRLATYAVEDYYGTTLAEVGEEFLGFTPSDKEQGIGVQWNKAKARLKTMDSLDIPDKYNTTIHRLKDVRNSVSHRYVENPTRDVLIEAREIAQEWAEWFIESSERYYESQEELTAEEAMESIARKTLESSIMSVDRYDYSDLKQEQEEINEEAEDLIGDLEALSSRPGGMSKGLVFLLADAMNLENEKESLLSQQSIREREEKIREYESSTRCLVIEPYDPSTGEIHICTHEYAVEDTHFWIPVFECPSDIQSTLKSLNKDSEIDVVFGTDQHGGRYIKDIR